MNIYKYAKEPFNDKKIISVFDSAFTRMIGAKQDELTEDFMVIQVYYFDIIKDLIYNGFIYKGEKYIYFTSSAGQIRTKKTVFVKESVWKKYEKTIMCGLTIDSINEKGGNNPNKHLAYMALTNSATDVWHEFDIDKTIVIDDFETNVYGTYDLVDDADYSIKRVSGYVPVAHTDGAGMMLPFAFGKEQKNQMVRLPWIKGLLGVFDFKKFIEIAVDMKELIHHFNISGLFCKCSIFSYQCKKSILLIQCEEVLHCIDAVCLHTGTCLRILPCRIRRELSSDCTPVLLGEGLLACRKDD